MRSVEKRAATVEEATEAALLELGIGITDAHVEVVSSPRRRGLFGGREAVVRVTATLEDEPAAESAGTAQETASEGGRASIDSTHEEPEAGGADPADAERAQEAHEMTDTFAEDGARPQEADVETDEHPDEPSFDDLTPEQRIELLDEESELAADFVEGLLDLLEVPGDIEIEVTEGSAVVNVSDVGSGLLIGRRGATLDALQELVRSSTQRQTQRRSHVRVDVEGYRARQLDKLRTKCRDAIAEVRETGQPVRLEPMDAYERKMMHDVVAKTGGVTSASEGTEPKRRVVVLPAE